MNQPTSFADLGLRQELTDNLISLQYDSMTNIQASALPLTLKNQDVVAKAQTGSGKTATFGLTILNKLRLETLSVQALVLCPTRELAEQVCLSIRRYARLMPNVKILNLSGGTPTRPQRDSLSRGAHIVVGTPGRILQHLELGSLQLSKLQTLVLDEADRMLDMGFFDDMDAVIAECPKARQTLLFSATFPEPIKKIATQLMRSPHEITVEEQLKPLDIEQRFYAVDSQSEKFDVLKALLLHFQPESTLVFCTTKQQTADIADQLVQNGFSAEALNGDMEQFHRDLAVVRFGNKSCRILVATDVAARGLDIKELGAVINFDLSRDKDVHTHRIGRTGRAGRKGLALSLARPNDLALYNATPCSRDELLPGSQPLSPLMVTLCFSAGKKDKIRPGDILGALTKDAGLPADTIGKINIMPTYSYVAISPSEAKKALQHFQNGKLKGRKVRVRQG